MRRLWRPVLDRIEPYEAGPPLEQLQAARPDLFRLSANENPLGPSQRVIDAIREEAPRAHLYPDGGGTALRQALGRQLGLPPEAVLLGNGADEILTLIAWAAFEPGDHVVIPHPSFEPYATVVTLSGAAPVLSPLVDYHIDLGDVIRRVSPRTKAVILCSPHNPTGTILRREPLIELLSRLGGDPPLVILDEAYRDFVDDPESPDGITLLDSCPTLILLRTFSKIAGLAGLRVGYAVARPEVIGRLDRVRAPYNVNRVAQAAALAALDDRQYRERTAELVRKERRFLTAELTASGLSVVPSQANFLLVRVGDSATAEGLRRAGILVRDGGAVGFPGYLRITVGTHDQNQRLLVALERAGG